MRSLLPFPLFLTFLLLITGCGSNQPKADQVKPIDQTKISDFFESIQVQDGGLLLKLHESGNRYLIKDLNRATQYGEVLTVPAGKSLELTDQHTTLTITASSEKPNQLFEVEHYFDGRSFGDSIKKTYYSILAPANSGKDAVIVEEPSKAVVSHD